ncbi:MAG: efflux RND transporter periplasmic adaptor subunit [Vicinamibacteria bacterium]
MRDAERAAAEAAFTLAELTYDRLEGLHAKRAATTQELDQSRAALAAARARVAAATARVSEAASAITAAEAARDGAGIALSHATLRAPFDGVVAHISVDPGTQVAPGMPVARVESAGRQVEVSLDAARASGLAAGQAATVLVDSAGADPMAGTITEVAHTASAGLQTITVTVALAEAGVTPGRFARVRFVGPTRTALAVPASAVVTRGQLTGVFVLDADRRARLRLVSPGATVDGLTEIVSGLDAGEVILASPPVHLTDGVPVTQGVQR